jgi:hypothetical protein
MFNRYFQGDKTKGRDVWSSPCTGTREGRNVLDILIWKYKWTGPSSRLLRAQEDNIKKDTQGRKIFQLCWMDSCLASDQRAAVVNKLAKSRVQRRKELLAGWIVVSFSKRTSVHAFNDIKNYVCVFYFHLFVYVSWFYCIKKWV